MKHANNKNEDSYALDINAIRSDVTATTGTHQVEAVINKQRTTRKFTSEAKNSRNS